jgi:tagatose 1,6-diphosphate aldolase
VSILQSVCSFEPIDQLKLQLREGLQLSPGKQRGLQALSDPRGIIAALAVDQRSALRDLFARASGLPAEGVAAEDLIQFKQLVSRILTPYATAILLDPEYGIPAAEKRHNRAGLILAYERSGYDKSTSGRLPSLLKDLSVAGLKDAGADAVKALLYYSPFSTSEINARKHTWVECVGVECLSADLPFFLELVSYHDDMDEKSSEFARIKPDVVTRSIEEFCKPRYAADVLKIGVPVNMKFVESPGASGGQTLYTRTEACTYFQRASQAATLPFIYLSEGVSIELFVDALDLAAEVGSLFSGVLCGRAIWQDGVSVFVRSGAAALEDWLCEQGVRNIQTVNAQLAAAHPWFEKLSTVSSGNR